MNTRRRRSETRLANRITLKDAGQSAEPGQPTVYQIRIKSDLEIRWAEADEGLIAHAEENGDTLLTVAVVDQAALHGLLRKLRDLGVPLVSINPAGDPPENPSEEEKKNGYG